MTLSKTPISPLHSGFTFRGLLHTLQARFIRLTFKQKFMAAAIFVGAPTIWSVAIGAPWMSVFRGLSICIATIVIVLRFSRFIPVLIPLFVYITGSAARLSVGLLVHSNRQGGVLSVRDIGGATVSVSIIALLSGIVAYKYSIGRAWVTISLALAATYALPYYLITLVPKMGLLSVHITLALVLFLRCGGIALTKSFWFRARLGKTTTDDVQPFSQTSPFPVILDNWNLVPVPIFKDSTKEKEVASIRLAISSEHKTALVAFCSTSGRISETGSAGVSLPGIDMSELLALLTKSQVSVSRFFGFRNQCVPLVICVKGASGLKEPRELGLFGRFDGEIASQTAILCSPEHLAEQLATLPGLARLRVRLGLARLVSALKNHA